MSRWTATNILWQFCYYIIRSVCDLASGCQRNLVPDVPEVPRNVPDVPQLVPQVPNVPEVPKSPEHHEYSLASW